MLIGLKNDGGAKDPISFALASILDIVDSISDISRSVFEIKLLKIIQTATLNIDISSI